MITVKEAASMLGVNQHWLYRLIKQQRLNATWEYGKGWQIDPQSVEDYKTSQVNKHNRRG
jgi:excisionase family DNA binding protein